MTRRIASGLSIFEGLPGFWALGCRVLSVLPEGVLFVAGCMVYSTTVMETHLASRRATPI